MAGDVKTQGFFTNNTKGNDFSYSPGCGGMGGGSCGVPATFRYIHYKIDTSLFLVRNRQLILQNKSFKVYYDAGPSGGCDHSNGASAEYDVYLAYDYPGSFDASLTTAKATIAADATLPFYMQFDDTQLPQPTSSDWNGFIWVIIDLRATGRMVGATETSKVFDTTNYDYDERL